MEVMTRHSNHLVWRDRVDGRINKVDRENQVRARKAEEKDKANALARTLQPQPSSSTADQAAATTEKDRE